MSNPEMQFAADVVNQLCDKTNPYKCPLNLDQTLRIFLITYQTKVNDGHVEITCQGDAQNNPPCLACRIHRRTIYIAPTDTEYLSRLLPSNFIVPFVTTRSPDIVGWLLTPPQNRSDRGPQYGNQ